MDQQTTYNGIQALYQDYAVQLYIDIKPYTTKELAALYDVPQRSFLKWLIPLRKVIGEKRGRYFTVKQVEAIFAKLSIPSRVREKNPG